MQQKYNIVRHERQNRHICHQLTSCGEFLFLTTTIIIDAAIATPQIINYRRCVTPRLLARPHLIWLHTVTLMNADVFIVTAASDD